MFNLITHKINDERSDYLHTHFLLETNGSAPSPYAKYGGVGITGIVMTMLYAID